ncbi:MAG: FG-GAP repeat protein [Thermoplasmata archaeon]|nr:FG-GAP repeat protein [Thermoplasmata archaeon]
MRKIYSFVFVLLLLATGFSIFPEESSIVDGTKGSTRKIGYWTMGINVSDISEASFVGEDAHDWSGNYVTGAGDVNGDGFDDILIGATGNDDGGTGVGQTYLILGKASGLVMDTDLSNADASFYGENAEDGSGSPGSGVGDVNGDGYDDILIGAAGNDDGGNIAGKTYLIFGKASGWLMDTNLSNADASFIGENSDDRSGASVSGVGDVNGDGFDDILIGARGNIEGGDPWAGQTYLILGKASGWATNTDLSNADASFIGEDATDMSGVSVSGAGDVNGDGFDDIIIGARSDEEGGDSAGQTYLILGKGSGWNMDTDLSNADASFIGEDAQDECGISVSGAGDVNGDGYDDILIGAYFNNEGGDKAGQIYLILGKASGWVMDIDLSDADASFIGENEDDWAGDSVSGAGDVNGDGYDDILIGVQRNNNGGPGAGQTYLILGKASGWAMDTILSNADGSFIGEDALDYIGCSVSNAGDVNGDGYVDILIGARGDEDGGSYAGKTYLITGFKITEPLVVYSIEIYSDNGYSTPISAADIGDLIHIEILGLDGNETQQDAAVINVTFRPGSVSMMKVTCIETGDNTGMYRGTFIIPPGTIYLDTLNFSSRKDPTKFVHLIIDKPFRPTSISSLKTYHDEGCTIEVDRVDLGDSFYIEVIGADANPATKDYALVNMSSERTIPISLPILVQETGINTGVYLSEFIMPGSFVWLENIHVASCRDPGYSVSVSVEKPFRPISIDSLKVYSDSGCSNEIDKIQSEDTMHIEVIGKDANALTRDFAFVNITSDKTIPLSIVILLRETDVNTGIYRGYFVIPNSTERIENRTIVSAKDSSKSANIMICTLIDISPEIPVMEVIEDEEYSVQYSNLGYADTYAWTFESDGGWLTFDSGTMILSGTPDNGDVGPTSVKLNLTDDVGHFEVQEFKINVQNIDPILSGENILLATQDQYYYIDYDCTDEGAGNTTYFIQTTAHWLTINEVTGELSGTPTNDDVGKVLICVTVYDGNGGMDHTEFNLIVINVNDQCYIDTENIVTIIQDEPYKRTYSVVDIDSAENFTWTLVTDAEWLSMDQDTGVLGVLEGTPTNDDVGIFTVNITVMDSGGLTDSTEFQLEVLNVNDRPEWVDVPDDMTITHGEFFHFNATATDIDLDTTLSYSIRSNPPSEIFIDSGTGIIEWHATIHIFESLSRDLEVTVAAFDGELYNNHTFIIEVLSSRAPSTTLLSPAKGEKVSSSKCPLAWEGSDPEGDELTYTIFLSKEEPLVSSLQEDVKIKTDFNHTSFTPGILEVGETYYWTVIPNDGCSDGRCSNDVFSFDVNAPPKVSDIDPQKASSGSKFSFYVRATDDDDTSHTFSLVEAPDGMTIDDLGKIEWTPTSGQIGEHIVIVNVSDGVDYELVSFKLNVEKGEKESSSLLPIVLLIAFVLIIVGVILFFVLSKKKDEKETPDEEGEVELTKEETYEAMYGKPAPKEEEGMTTEELKGFIHEQIEGLEEGKGEE